MALTSEELKYLDQVSQTVLNGMIVAGKVPFQGTVMQSACESAYRVGLTMLTARKDLIKDHGIEKEEVVEVQNLLLKQEVVAEKAEKKATEKLKDISTEAAVSTEKPKRKRGRPKKAKKELKMNPLFDEDIPNPF